MSGSFGHWVDVLEAFEVFVLMLVWFCFRKADWNDAFNFSSDLGFLANCIAETNGAKL